MNFSVGRGHAISRSRVASAQYRPVIPETLAVSTGSIVEFAIIDGEPEIALSVAFLAGADVKVGHNRLWHVRPGLAEHISQPIRAMLSYGRSGRDCGLTQFFR